ncbi:MAG: phosphate signaling complex protein PhoU [Chloroflexi bacterium]|nr:phosphate signaling complex protein PhoU [Chloroflexota bacterium]
MRLEHNLEPGLAELKQRLLTMASHAEYAVTNAVRAVMDRDDAPARRVKADDTIIDQFEMELDEIALDLLALRTATASDLRLITVAMKISHDLERVGDEATTIARRALELNVEPQLKPFVDIPRMARMALEMLKDALDAFVHRAPGAARSVIPRDKEVDAINKELQGELVNCVIAQPATITRCLNLIVIAKSLERIADHATNIAEEVVYLYEGHDIRHTGKGAESVA